MHYVLLTIKNSQLPHPNIQIVYFYYQTYFQNSSVIFQFSQYEHILKSKPLKFSYVSLTESACQNFLYNSYDFGLHLKYLINKIKNLKYILLFVEHQLYYLPHLDFKQNF